MSEKRNYTINTLSGNLDQRTNPIFSAGTNTAISLRGTYTPYTVIKTGEGDVADNRTFPKFPFGQYEPYTITTSPIAKYTFDANGPGGTGSVADDSGNNLTGTMSCSWREGGSYSDGTCNMPEFDNGVAPFTVGPLTGARSLHFSGGVGGRRQSAGMVRFQGLREEEKWRIMTGSFSVSLWYYPTNLNAYQRTADGGTGTTVTRWTMGQGATTLFSLCIPPDDNGVSDENPSGSFSLMLQQYNMDYYQTGPISWSWHKPGDGVNPALNVVFGYSLKNRDGDWQTAYFNNGEWNHVMFCVSGDEGDSDRFIAVYINGQKLDAHDVPGYAPVPVTAWTSITTGSNYDYLFPVTTPIKDYAPYEYVFLGDIRPKAAADVHATGSFDSVAIWDRYLTAAQVTAVYESSGTLFDIALKQSVRKKS